MRHAHGQRAKSTEHIPVCVTGQRPSAEPAADGSEHEEGETAGAAAENAGDGQQDAPEAVALLYAAFMLAAPDTDRTIVAIGRPGEILRSLPPTQASARDREQDQQRPDDPVHGAAPITAATGRCRSWRTHPADDRAQDGGEGHLDQA